MKTSVDEAARGLGVLPFAACYVYSPGGADPASRRSRRLCASVKAGGTARIAGSAAVVRALAAPGAALAAWFEPAALLVPVPASAPRSAGPLWAAGEIAQGLVRAGLGAGARPLLLRRTAVRKSATAPLGARPTVAEHFASFAIADRDAVAYAGEVRDMGSDCSGPFVLVDDVVTRGRTLFAAACALRTAYPQADIRAFALLRTMGFAAGVARLVEPCIGEIRWRRGDAYRVP
ncbi:MAG TPA: hypothetical protein VMU86_09005 [Steroidobacteraceae bacterium]|nr:hypothetical protein [Steroidobacteraceae bacterium]